MAKKKLSSDDPLPYEIRIGHYEELFQKIQKYQKYIFQLLKNGSDTEKYFVIPKTRETIEAWKVLSKSTHAEEIQQYHLQINKEYEDKKKSINSRGSIKDPHK
ncbi:MAG TPA: hypothetical protein ENI23_09380 [bacterium]|nr:hypothetical protein [bacterium]